MSMHAIGLDWVDSFNSRPKYEEVHCGTAFEPAVSSNKSDDELVSVWLTPCVSLSIGF